MKKSFAALALSVAMGAAAFSAQAIEVRPLVATFQPNHRAGVMTVINTDARAQTYQIFVDKLTVENGARVRSKTAEIRFAPSVFTVQPGASQTIRYIYSGAQGAGEGAYRVRVQEIPTELTPVRSGVVYTTSMEFPWFWRQDGMVPKLSARWDASKLIVKNSGTATAQLVDLVSGTINKKGLVGYVLPGEEARFELKAKTALPVSLTVNGKDIVLEVK